MQKQGRVTRSDRALLVSVLVVLLGACGSEDSAAPPGATPATNAQGVSPPPAPAAEPLAESAGERLARPCLSCHEAQLFSGRDADELIAQMQGIAAGDVSHPPLPATLSDDDLAAIAAFLSARPADAGG